MGLNNNVDVSSSSHLIYSSLDLCSVISSVSSQQTSLLFGLVEFNVINWQPNCCFTMITTRSWRQALYGDFPLVTYEIYLIFPSFATPSTRMRHLSKPTIQYPLINTKNQYLRRHHEETQSHVRIQL